MCLVYKILNGVVDGLDHLLELDNARATRGHSLKLKHQNFRVNVRKNYFSVRVVSFWNSLADELVTSDNFDTFQSRLKQVKFDEVNALYFD